MTLKRLAIAVLVVSTSFVAYATAQENVEEDFEFSGMIGRTFISDQGIRGDGKVRSGNGLTFEANYSARVLGRRVWSLYLEFPLTINLDEDLNSDAASLVPSQYSSYFFTPAARIHVFPDAGLTPWVSVGGGYGRISESSRLLFGGPNPGKTGTNTGVLEFGAGLDVKPFSHIGFRAEVRDFWSGVPKLNVDTGRSRQHNFFVASGVVFHF